MKQGSHPEPASPWRLPPQEWTLGRDEVHVWRLGLGASAIQRERLEQILSVDERERAGRFYFQKDRDHFIVGRGRVRTLLGRYLGLPPEQLRFSYSAHGKPSLAPGSQGLRFNVSHSHGLALVAVTRDRELGVDVEYIRCGVVEEPIAERFFSTPEVAALRALPPALQPEGFFNCWTRKESYIKARGEGLSVRLDQFQVSLTPGEPAALLSIQDDPAEADRWSLRALAPGPGYAGAVAVEGHDWRLRCWEWVAEES